MPGDINYKNCELLLHCNGTNGDKFLKDYSPRNQKITFIGNAQISSTQSKFNGTSLFIPDVSSGIEIEMTGSATGTNAITNGQNFTIELQVFPTFIGGTLFHTFLNCGGTNSGFIIRQESSGRLFSYVWAGGANVLLSVGSTTTNPTLNTWQHLAFVKNGGTLTLYKDGVSIASLANTNTCLPFNPQDKVRVSLRGQGEGFVGYIAEVAIYRNYAKYTAAFSPPTSPVVDNYGILSGNITESLAITDWRVSAITTKDGNQSGNIITTGSTYSLGTNTLEPCSIILSPKIDSVWTTSTNYDINSTIVPSNPDTNQKIFKATSYLSNNIQAKSSELILHFDGTNGSTTITDNSPTPKTPTVSGNAQISNAQSKFGGTSLKLDGTGDFITYPASKWLEVIRNTFTLTGWFYHSANPATSYRLLGIGGGGVAFNGTNGIHLLISTTTTSIGLNISNNTAAPIAISNNQAVAVSTWHHFSLVVDASSLTAYLGLNGTVVSGSISTWARPTTLAATLALGIIPGETGLVGLTFNGHIDDLVWINGIADSTYTANYTVPTTAYNHLVPVSGTTEPTWPSSGTVTDGDLEWTFVDNLVDPKVLGPKIPV